MSSPFEKPSGPAATPAHFLSDFGGVYALNAVVGFLFACTGPVAIILSTGARGGLSEADITSWIFGSFFLNGFLTMALSLYYRQPLVLFWSIPGAVLVGPALGHLSFPEVIGAFLATGVLMLVLGVSGWVRRAMDAIPLPIVMAMVAGVFLRFGLDWVRAFHSQLGVALPMTLAFVALSVWPRVARVLPPLVGALVAGAVLGIVLVLLEKAFPNARSYIPSATAIGLAFTTPAYNTISMFVGALVAVVLEKKRRELADRALVPVSSGLIAGESLMAVVIAAWSMRALFAQFASSGGP
jgi:benzoate membrane transport protein